MKNKKLKLIFWCFVLIFLFVVSVFLIINQSQKEYDTYVSPKLDITLFGENKQYIVLQRKLPNQEDNIGGIGVGKNYISTFDSKLRKDDEADDYQFEEGESYTVTLHDLRKKGFPTKTFDIVATLDKVNISGEIYTGGVINYQDKDYLWISIRDRENNDTEKFLDIESGELIDAPDIDLFSEGFTPEASAFIDAEYTTNLSDELTDNRNISVFYQKYYGSEFGRYLPDVPFTLEGTNFAHEYPDFAKALENDNTMVYARPGMVDVETFFNTVIHWAAPEGQEVLELYATNEETGVNTLIKSYADFVAWREQNPKE